MRTRIALFLATLLVSAAGFAQVEGLPGGPPAPNEKIVTLEGRSLSRTGDEVKGVLTVAISKSWHINSNKPLDAFLLGTKFTLDPKTARLIDAKFPPHVLKTFTFSGDDKLAVFEGTIEVPFTAELTETASSIKGSLYYQACNDSVCLPPRTANVEISIPPHVLPLPDTHAGAPATATTPAATGTSAPATATSAASSTSTKAPSVAATPAPAVPATTPAPLAPTAPASGSGYVPLSAAPKGGAAPPSGLENNAVAAAFASHGLPLTLLILFVGGLALNLTPCVFPLINITLGFFAMQSDGRRSRRIALSTAYVAGIVVTYSTLGVVAALSGKLFGSWLQHPAVLVGLAVMMLIFAASMFGAWDFRVPQFIANRSQGRAGAAGALTMGLLVGIVAAPCVGPVVAGLFALVASIGKPLIGFVMFGALGFGLGFPYLVALSALPRPGEWMVHVKKGMGFVLVAMAVYFVRPLIGEEWFRWGVAACLLVGAAFLFFVRSAAGTGGRALRLGVGAILLVAGAAFAIPRRGGSELHWTPYDASKLAAAAADHKPVIVDFSASWCIPCKEFDQVTFADRAVANELDRYVRLKADLTKDTDPAVVALRKQFAVDGVPTIMFLDSTGREKRELRLTGFEKPELFLARARQVQ